MSAAYSISICTSISLKEERRERREGGGEGGGEEKGREGEKGEKKEERKKRNVLFQYQCPQLNAFIVQLPSPPPANTPTPIARNGYVASLGRKLHKNSSSSPSRWSCGLPCTFAESKRHVICFHLCISALPEIANQFQEEGGGERKTAMQSYPNSQPGTAQSSLEQNPQLTYRCISELSRTQQNHPSEPCPHRLLPVA